MDEILRKQQQNYDRTWSQGLAQGKEQRGNLDVNLMFLDRTGLIRPKHHVLEIGCGIGTVVHRLKMQGCIATGTDISHQAIAYGLEKYPNLDLSVSPAEKIDFPDHTFDLVLSFDVLEHLFHVDDHLAEVRHILKIDGAYLLSTPNKIISAPYDTLKHCGFSWKNHHPSLHSWRGLRRRFRKHGFICEFVKMNTITEFSLNKIDRYNILTWFARRIDTARLPLCCQSNFYCIARKQSEAP